MFVATKFPEQKPSANADVDDENEVSEACEQASFEPGRIISVVGKDRKYATKTSVHDRYACRP